MTFDPEPMVGELPELPLLELPQFPEFPLGELLSTEIDGGFVLRPGDTLLLGAPANITMDQMEFVRQHLRERLPKLADVIILGGLTVQAVYRDDKEDDDE